MLREESLNPASVWLTASEQASYIAGQRVFRYSSRALAAQLA